MNRKSLKDFFREIGIEDEHDFPWCKNLYKIINSIHSNNAYEAQLKKYKDIIHGPLVVGPPHAKNRKGFKQKIAGAVSGNNMYSKTKLEAKTAIVLTTSMMYKMGYELTPEMIEQLKFCYRAIKRNKDEICIDITLYEDIVNEIISGKERSSEEAQEYKAGLKRAMEILSDDKRAKKVFHDIVEEVKVEDIDAINELANLALGGRVSLNPRANVNSGIIKRLQFFVNRGIESYETAKEREKEQAKLGQGPDKNKDEEYEDLMNEIYYKAIQDNLKNEKDLILALYQHLNEVIVYNTIAFSWSQKHEKVKAIIEHDRSEDMNKEDNAVTCHTWSYAMRDLLSKAGYDAYVVGKKSHRFVIFFDDDGNPWFADGTNAPSDDNPYWFKGADIARLKMGLMPDLLFRITEVDERLRPDDIFFSNEYPVSRQIIEKDQYEGSFSLSLDIGKYRKEDGKIDYRAIFKDIDKDPNLMAHFRKAVLDTHDGTQMASFVNEVVKSLVQGHEDDDLLVDSCVGNIVYILKSGSKDNLSFVERLVGETPEYSIGCSGSLYAKDGKKTKLVPLMYVDSKDGVKYYIWLGPEGFTEVSNEELKEKIISGEIHSSVNNGSEDSRFIAPGIYVPRIPTEQEERMIFGEVEVTDEDGKAALNELLTRDLFDD